MQQVDIIQSPAFDPGWMKERLENKLNRDGQPLQHLSGLEIIQVSESSKRIAILYDTRIRTEFQDIQQYFLGIVVKPEHYERELGLIRRRKLVAPQVGDALLLFPETSLIVMAFPNDRHIHLLSATEISNWLATHLPSLNDGHFQNQDWLVKDLQVETLRYVPGKRYTARCRAEVTLSGGDARKITFIAKQFKTPKKAQQLFDNLQKLHTIHAQNSVDASGSGEKELSAFIPRAVGIHLNRGIVFIEDIPGKNLEQCLREIDIPTVLPVAGRLLAAFHNASQSVRKTVTVDSEMAKNERAFRAISKRLPTLRAELSHLFEGLHALAEKLPPTNCLLHGTYRINHIFLHRQRLFLLDLDSVCMGNPAYDIANFISSLYYLDAQDRLTVDERRQICHHFLEGYRASAIHLPPVTAIAWFLADMFIKKQAYKYVKHLFDDREDKVIQMLTMAKNVLDAVRNGVVHNSYDEFIDLIL